MIKRYRLSSYQGSPRLKEYILGDIVKFEDYELANRIIELMAKKISLMRVCPWYFNDFAPKSRYCTGFCNNIEIMSKCCIDYFTAKAMEKITIPPEKPKPKAGGVFDSFERLEVK